jgi:hypothetical protein
MYKKKGGNALFYCSVNRVSPPVSFGKKIAIFAVAPMMGDMLKETSSEDSL